MKLLAVVLLEFFLLTGCTQRGWRWEISVRKGFLLCSKLFFFFFPVCLLTVHLPRTWISEMVSGRWAELQKLKGGILNETHLEIGNPLDRFLSWDVGVFLCSKNHRLLRNTSRNGWGKEAAKYSPWFTPFPPSCGLLQLLLQLAASAVCGLRLPNLTCRRGVSTLSWLSSFT